MIEDFFNHKCNIYHAIDVGKSPGYGLPTSEEYSYPDLPDISNQICHFAVKSSTLTIAQNNPTNDLDARIKLTLPFGVDVRVNDKIVSNETGYAYIAEVPRHPQNHHTFVYIKRTGIGRAL